MAALPASSTHEPKRLPDDQLVLNPRRMERRLKMHWIDPNSLPAVAGTVKQFVPNAHGDLDGMVLNDNAGKAILVHFPPHLSEPVKAAMKAGDAIRVHGVRPRGAVLIAAVSLVAANGHA